MTDTPSHPVEVTCHDVHQRLQQNDDFVFLDCRENDEYQTAHIEGATLVPMSGIVERIEELMEHQGKDIVVHCHHGGRSLRVAMWLREQGLSRAQSMAGGIDAWSQSIDSSIPRY